MNEKTDRCRIDFQSYAARVLAVDVSDIGAFAAVSLPLAAVFFLLQNFLIHAAPQTMRYPLIITLIVLCALVTAESPVESPVSFSMLGMLLLFGVMTLAMLWLNQEPAIPLAAIVLSAFLLAVLVQIRQQATLTGAALLFLFSLVVLRVQHHLRCSMPAPSLPSDNRYTYSFADWRCFSWPCC